MKEFPERTEADLYLWVAYHPGRLRERYGVMPPDREVAAALAEQFSGRPVGALAKTVARAIAAVKAAVNRRSRRKSPAWTRQPPAVMRY